MSAAARPRCQSAHRPRSPTQPGLRSAPRRTAARASRNAARSTRRAAAGVAGGAGGKRRRRSGTGIRKYPGLRPRHRRPTAATTPAMRDERSAGPAGGTDRAGLTAARRRRPKPLADDVHPGSANRAVGRRPAARAGSCRQQLGGHRGTPGAGGPPAAVEHREGQQLGGQIGPAGELSQPVAERSAAQQVDGDQPRCGQEDPDDARSAGSSRGPAAGRSAVHRPRSGSRTARARRHPPRPAAAPGLGYRRWSSCALRFRPPADRPHLRGASPRPAQRPALARVRSAGTDGAAGDQPAGRSPRSSPAAPDPPAASGSGTSTRPGGPAADTARIRTARWPALRRARAAP